MTPDNSIVQERKRKFLIALPILTVPFLVLLFYTLGGGKGNAAPNGPRLSALSTTLPDPLTDDQQPRDKLSIYQRADKDSAEIRQQQEYDPFAPWMPAEEVLPPAGKSPFSYSAGDSGYTPSLINPTPDKQSPEAMLEQKIAALENALRSPDSVIAPTSPVPALPATTSALEVERLEAMMQMMANQSTEPDPELEQAENLIDKILDIQHPDRVKNKLKDQSVANKKEVFAVNTVPPDNTIDLLQSEAQAVPDSLLRMLGYMHVSTPSNTRFYDEETEPAPEENALLAAVHETQILVSGATIKIRLEQDAYVQGQLIPKGSFVFGVCNLSGERLQVTIQSIRRGNSIYPVSLAAYDLDGLPGIRIPGSINRETSKESSDRAIQALNMATLDPSIGAQAASAGIEAAKNLLTKKVKLVKVSVKAGYPLLLASGNNHF